MFEGLVVTGKHAEYKRGLLTFPLAVFIQLSVVTAAVLWGVFSVVDIEAPSSIPIFTAPVRVAPPPPAGNPEAASKPRQTEKPAVAVKIEKKELVEPDTETVKTAEAGAAGESYADGRPGVPGGIEEDWGGTTEEDPFENKPVTERQIVQAGEVVAMRLVFSPPPEYPPMALRLGIRGKVEVEMVVDEKGLVESARIVSSSNRMFDEPVLKAVRAWRFTPPVDRSGQKVAVYYRRMIAFNF
ncbi:MAG TPA: TonB family protein [Acidobacteriota bacterium]|nr:TonB family protein [Acidobacteriota bacterium]HNT18649.1 TonB family protein [Acidobacteriota bacterium]